LAEIVGNKKLEMTGGTDGFISPEKCNGEAGSFKSDSYAFGIIAYEMISIAHSKEIVNLTCDAMRKPTYNEKFYKILNFLTSTFRPIADCVSTKPPLKNVYYGLDQMLEPAAYIAIKQNIILDLAQIPDDYKSGDSRSIPSKCIYERGIYEPIVQHLKRKLDKIFRRYDLPQPQAIAYQPKIYPQQQQQQQEPKNILPPQAYGNQQKALPQQQQMQGQPIYDRGVGGYQPEPKQQLPPNYDRGVNYQQEPKQQGQPNYDRVVGYLPKKVDKEDNKFDNYHQEQRKEYAQYQVERKPNEQLDPITPSRVHMNASGQKFHYDKQIDKYVDDKGGNIFFSKDDMFRMIQAKYATVDSYI